MIRALAILLVCQLLGETLVRFFVLPVPGPVVGLVILALALIALRKDRPAVKEVELTSDTILGTLGILFVPAGVGVIQQLGLLGELWFQIIVTLVLSTALAMLATVGTFLWVKKIVGPSQ